MSLHTRRPTAERREEIARAALRIIGERGLTCLTTATLAREVGLTSGALFRHFASCEAILAEAVRYAILRIEETFPDASLPPLERLLLLAKNRVRLFSSDAGLAWLLRSDQAYLTLPEQAVKELRALVRRSKRVLLDAIREGAERGDIRGDIEPEALLVVVMGTIHVLAGMRGVHRQAAGAAPDLEPVLAALRRLLEPPERGTNHHGPCT